MTSTTRALSFGTVSEDYDRFRPGPPAAAVDWLVPAGARAVVDVGAGTGALTAQLAARVAEVTAVEPDERMRAVLARRVPAATVLAGTAEALPLEDRSQDAVLASSAWHWVDPERAVPEAARVLRPGGTLGVVWTGMDREVAWVGELQQTIRARLSPPVVGADRGPRRLELPASAADAFSPVEGPHIVRFTHRFTRDALLGLAGTYSAMIIHPEKASLLEAIRTALSEDPRFATAAGVEIPMISRCFRARRTTG
ncbi:MAG TPA: class I SAM-dependent methyltransferase [Baekduia sp.]